MSALLIFTNVRDGMMRKKKERGDVTFQRL